MAIKLDILQEICDLAIKQVQELYPELQLMFIPHNHGMFQDVVATSEYEVLKHPAGRIASTILEKHQDRELSGFLGMAIHREVRWFGFGSRDHILGLFNINTDEFETPKDVRRAIYQNMWHAIDLIEVRQLSEYKDKFRSGPMIPKRSPMNLARLNLQADVFSAVMSGLQGEEDALETLASQRALDSIAPVHQRRAEDFPFVIAFDAAKYAYQQLRIVKPVKAKYMFYARQLAIEVGRTFDDKSIRDWWRFSEPAQDMAWRKFKPEFILGCAIYTCDDPFVRATGHLVSDCTGLTALTVSKLGGSYNAYADQEEHKLLHRELQEKAFQEAMEQGIQEESGRPLIFAAMEQNEKLAEGLIVGWCAHALHAAARAFDSAKSNGSSPAQAARLEFEATKESTTWETLKEIGGAIVEEKRKGFGITLGNVAEIANQNPSFAPILSSIRITMKDPAYVQKLEAANDLSVPAMPPRAPAPQAAPQVSGPSGPAFAPAAPGMGLGGSSASNAVAHHNAMRERLRQEQEKSGGDDRTQ